MQQPRARSPLGLSGASPRRLSSQVSEVLPPLLNGKPHVTRRHDNVVLKVALHLAQRYHDNHDELGQCSLYNAAASLGCHTGVAVVLTCGGYLAASSLLILLNKHLLSTDGFPFPLMLSGSGMVMTLVATSTLVRIPAVVPDRQVVTRDDYVRRILPLAFCSAATLALGNIAYLHLDVGLLQMLKSCCPVFVMLVAITFRLERFSLSLVASISCIAAGTATTAATGSGSVSLIGLIVQFASEMCEALRLCLAQLLLCNMALHQFEVLRLMSSACVLFLCCGVWLLEWRRFSDTGAWRRISAHPHWYLAAASLGFVLNLLAFAVIKLTGSLTQKVLGTVKNILLVVFSVSFMGESITLRQWIGYQVSLLGFVWYQHQKITGTRAAKETHAHANTAPNSPRVPGHHQGRVKM